MPQPSALVTGLGLMGGSLAAALTAAGWRVLLHHRRQEVASEAEQRGWGQAVSDPAQALSECDLAIVCTPVGAIAATVRLLAQTRSGAVITDVGSTKGGICAELADLARAGRFVGSHPMCGSHLQGLGHARADLYRGALTLITPDPQAPATAIAVVERLWQAVGSRVLRMDPHEHDHAVVAASHLPHLLASTAAALLDATSAPLCAGGFRDTTRVAAGSAQLWSEILLANRNAVLDRLNSAIAHLQTVQATLRQGDQPSLIAWLEAGRAGRQRFERAAEA